MPEAPGTARRWALGLSAIVALTIGRAVQAQHALSGLPPPSQPDAGIATGPSNPDAPPTAPRESQWRDRFNPLAPIVRGLRDVVPAESSPAPATQDPAVRTAERRPRGLVSLQVHARYGQHWREGDADVYLLRGDCAVLSGAEGVHGQQLVLWREPMADGNFHVYAYFEGDVQITRGGRRESQPASDFELDVSAFQPQTDRLIELEAPPDDPVYHHAAAKRGIDAARVQPVQYSAPAPGPLIVPPGTPAPSGAPPLAAPPALAPGLTPQPAAVASVRHVSIYPRALGQSFSMQTVPSQDSVPPEYITTITGGVRIVVDDVPVELNGQPVLTTIDLAADRAIIWTDANRVNEFTTSFELVGDNPCEVYLEGNIEVRQGTSVLRADRAFYDLSEERGLLSDAEVRGFLPQVNSVVRLRAEQIRQVAHDKFHARHGWITTSDMGIPGYRIEASDIFMERRPTPGFTTVNPQTGQREGGMMWFTSTHNRLYVENIPVAYFPYISSPAEDPNIPLRSINFGYGTVFGGEIRTVWDVEALFGLTLPDGADWRLNLDYLSKRGPGIGTKFKHYAPINLFGIPAVSQGEADAYYIHDTGTDVLGADRLALPLETEHRGRALMRHRLTLPFNTWIQSELGYLSDRNVREQYWESDWDGGKDYENLLQLNYQWDNFTASAMTRTRLFDFENTTTWLPRGDVTLLSQPLGPTPLLWSTHSSIGYAQLHPADPPFDPAIDVFTPLPYFADREGVVAMTRHELDLPLSAGPFNIVPYVLGEAAYWQEDLTGDELGRLYGSAGVRGSILFSKYMPQVYSNVFGLNGLAHKMTLDADYSYSESTEPLSRIAQYNEFDEDAQERFRTRFPTLEFGGLLPPQFDPRGYAVRSGAGRFVTAPWHELVDDLHVARLGWRHRLQTRVGNPQAPRIYDWMTLDLEASLFPNADRDNFGETVGLISANYVWNVGPRTSLLANGVVDVFDDGQHVWNIGLLSNRPSRGSVYVGVRGLDAGPIETALLIASASYHPTEKWICTVGTAYDVVENMDRGQSFTVTRVGEYLLFVVGAGYDRSRNAWSFNFSIQPKFGNFRLAPTQLSSLTGVSQ